MKIKALANLSGAVGKRQKGEEFTADAATARSLIDRKLAVEVAAETKPVPKKATGAG